MINAASQSISFSFLFLIELLIKKVREGVIVNPRPHCGSYFTYKMLPSTKRGAFTNWFQKTMTVGQGNLFMINYDLFIYYIFLDHRLQKALTDS